MESRKRQFVVQAVPCFNDVSDMEVKLFGIPSDVSSRVRQACIETLKHLGRLGATNLRCTLDNSGVMVDVIAANAESSINKPIFATLM